MNKTLLISDTHLKPHKENNPNLSKWEYQSQKYCLDKILDIIQKEKPNKIIHLGDLLDTAFPRNYELDLLDYFFSAIPKEIEFILISGNHELDRDSNKREYYWEFMKEFYEQKYNAKIYDWYELGKDLYCSHKHISKLETLTKSYRYVFSHIRSSGDNKFITDEINMVMLKQSAEKVFLGDIHNHLEYDNVVYCGQSSWVDFPSEFKEEQYERVIPSVVILNEDTREHTRINLFDSESPYQKKFKRINFEEFDSLKQIAEEINQEFQQKNNFYKVRIFAKKFMIERLREAFAGMKHCVILDIVNLTLKDTQYQDIQVNTILKDNLDKISVSANCLEYCKKALSEPRLEDLLCSTYATLEGSLERENNEGDN